MIRSKDRRTTNHRLSTHFITDRIDKHLILTLLSPRRLYNYLVVRSVNVLGVEL